MDHQLLKEAVKRINALQVGARFTIDSLLDELWLDLGPGLARRQFGFMFSSAVRSGAVPKCKWLGPLGTNRTVTYERIA